MELVATNPIEVLFAIFLLPTMSSTPPPFSKHLTMCYEYCSMFLFLVVLHKSTIAIEAAEITKFQG
jgi:hypothetical protein